MWIGTHLAQAQGAPFQKWSVMTKCSIGSTMCIQPTHHERKSTAPGSQHPSPTFQLHSDHILMIHTAAHGGASYADAARTQSIPMPELEYWFCQWCCNPPPPWTPPPPHNTPFKLRKIQETC